MFSEPFPRDQWCMKKLKIAFFLKTRGDIVEIEKPDSLKIAGIIFV